MSKTMKLKNNDQLNAIAVYSETELIITADINMPVSQFFNDLRYLGKENVITALKNANWSVDEKGFLENGVKFTSMNNKINDRPAIVVIID